MREKATLFCRGLQRLLFCGLLVSALIFTACNKTPGSQGSGYTVTFSVEGSNGTLTAQVGGNTIPQSPITGLSAGSKVMFTAIPSSGYMVKQWMENKKPVNGTNTSYTLVVKDSSSVTVQFMKAETSAPQPPASAVKHKVTITGITNGSVTATPALPADGMVAKGTEIMFTAAPKDGYMLTSWKVNDATVSGTDLTRTVRIEKNTTVSTVFEKYYTVTLGNIEHGKLSVSPELKDSKVAENTVLTFTATSDEGYEVDTWTVSDGSFEAGTGASGQTEAKLKVTKDVTVGVSFKLKTFTVTYSVDSGSPGLTLQVEYEGRPGEFLTSPIQNVPYGTKLLFKAETTDPSVDSGLVPEWTIKGSTAKEGRQQRGSTVTVSITDTTTVTVKLVPVSAQELLKKLEPQPHKTVTEDFFLTTYFAGHPITWKSSDETVIKIGSNDPHSSKVQASVTRDIVDRKVMLTATLTQGSETATRSFDVTVQALTKIVVEPAGSEQRTFTYTFTHNVGEGKNKHDELEIVRENGGNKGGSRYKVTVDPAKKTLTANLMAEYQNGNWQTIDKLEESLYKFKARSVLYTYMLTKLSDNKYTITITSKYDTEKPWYEQYGIYETSNDGPVLYIDDQQPTPTLIIKTKDDKEYQSSLSEVKNNGRFTATNKADSSVISVTVDDSQKNGTLTGTIGGTPYTASFKSVNME